MKPACEALTYVAGLMTQCSTSEHKVLLAIALAGGDFETFVKLSFTDLEELTGLSRSGVRLGVTQARANGHIEQVQEANSFGYLLCHVVTQNGLPSDTKRVTKKHTRGDTGVTTKHISLHEVTQQNEPSPYTEFRSLEREEISVEKTEAFQTVARIVKRDVGFLTKRNFDFEAAVALWGEQLEPLWQRAVAVPNRKPGEKPIWRFQDACERNLNLGLVPPAKAPPPAPPAQPDKNGIVIGEVYWQPEFCEKVRVFDFSEELQAYALEVPLPYDMEPCRGRYRTIYSPSEIEPFDPTVHIPQMHLRAPYVA